jgi:diacylglycerol kinase (ATP)
VTVFQKETIRVRSWDDKFSDAFRGVRVGMRGQSSFQVHLPAALVVGLAAWALRVTRWEWCLLVLCVALVWAAELFNSAIETLARVITRDQQPEIGDALDVASGAVLVIACGSAVVGLLILGWRIAIWLSGWDPRLIL